MHDLDQWQWSRFFEFPASLEKIVSIEKEVDRINFLPYDLQ
jgi:hypothetical protein